jgi:hypothetical protein
MEKTEGTDVTRTMIFEPTDPRLGRHVQHDPRSLGYAHGVLPRSALQPVAWTRRAGIFDQGDKGSCTGNAAAGLLGTDSKARTGLTSAVILDYGGTTTLEAVSAAPRDTGRITVPVDEALALRTYSLATQLDEFSGQWPPTDTGSSGVGAAKALQKLDLATGYTHVFSPAALQSALQTGPAMAGTQWMNSQFDPEDGPDGQAVMVVDRTSGVAGGHEYVIHQWDPANGRYRMTNSWGVWGTDGMAWISEDDLHWLLSQDGDVTVPVWNTAKPKTVTNQQMYDGAKTQWALTQAWGAYKGLKL